MEVRIKVQRSFAKDPKIAKPKKKFGAATCPLFILFKKS